MKKPKKIIWLSIAMLMVLLCFKGCRNKIHMDEEKCAEVALEYMKNKYGKEFVLISSSEIMKIHGPAGYAKVEVQITESEASYWVTVYPDKEVDKDKDGYYDSYKVVSDDYMCHLLNSSVKNEMNELLKASGLTRFINSVGIRQGGGGFAGFSGFAADFPVQSEDTISLFSILNQYRINIYCSIDIPEREYSDTLQDNITKSIQSLLTKDDFIYISMDVYDDEKYNEFEELYNNGEGYYSGLGIKRIEFVVEKEN